MNKQWTDIFHTEIERFKDTIGAFDKGEIDRKDYKGVSGGLGSYAQRDPSKHMLRLRLPGGRLTMERLKFLAEVVERDRRDSQREAAPLRQAEDAVVADTTSLDLEGSFQLLLGLARKHLGLTEGEGHE